MNLIIHLKILKNLKMKDIINNLSVLNKNNTKISSCKMNKCIKPKKIENSC